MEQTATPAPADTMLLELNLYTNLTWQGKSYQKGMAYRFSRETALQLLQEADCGRPVWKMHRTPKVKKPENTVVDMTTVKAAPPEEEGPVEGRRIDVGSDDEIRDLLPSSDEDITV